MTSHISTEDIARLSQLCNLSLTGAETVSLQKDIEAIINYITKLSELDTEGVEPTYQVGGLNNVYREDEPRQTIETDQLLELTAEKKDHQIKVPKVL